MCECSWALNSGALGRSIAEGETKRLVLASGREIEFELEKLPYTIKRSLLGFVDDVLTYVQNSKGEYFKVHAHYVDEED